MEYPFITPLAARPTESSSCLRSRIVDLRKYDGKRIAVVLSINGTERVVTGVARYVDDPILGNSICIVADEIPSAGGNYELLISELHWDGEIADGSEYGCDVCFRSFAQSPSSPRDS